MKTDCYIYTLITGDFLFQVMETSDEQAEKRLKLRNKSTWVPRFNRILIWISI